MGKITSLLNAHQRLTKGDEPFVPAKDISNEARLDMIAADFHGYALSYYEAACKVIDAALEKEDHWPDLALYPSAYLYRHYLELQLKRILWSYGQKLEGHDLKDLWAKVRTLVGPEWPNTEDLDTAEYCILRFHEHDSSREAFRYPSFRKHGGPTLMALHCVDLMNLRDVMLRLAGFLEALAVGVNYRCRNGEC